MTSIHLKVLDIDYWFLENGGTHNGIGLDTGGTFCDYRGSSGVGPDLSKRRIGITLVTNYNWNGSEPRLSEGSRSPRLLAQR